MNFKHCDLTIDLPDEWWNESGMFNFVPTTKSYIPDSSLCRSRDIFLVRIEDVEPLCRADGVGVFNDNDDATARERVLSILNGFCVGDALPPVEVVRHSSSSKFRYKLVAGAHRFYCSLAAGFSYVPATWGFDINAPEG